jgi:HD-like signal output (HDOD) protein
MINLKALIEKASSMTPLPQSAVRLAQVASDPKSHLDEVIELISFDQSLTVKVLGAANSAASASRIHIGTVHEAVMRLGSTQVMALTVAASTRKLLEAPVPEYGYSEGALWRHSVAAAVAAEIIPLHCRSEVPRETFSAALLHDIGKLVMARFLTPEVLYFIKQAEEQDHLTRLEAETTILTAQHAEIGGLIAQRWKLPERLVLGISYHHNPEQCRDVIAYLTYLANLLAKDLEAKLDQTAYDLVISSEVLDRLEISFEEIDKIRAGIEMRYQQISARYLAV